MKIYSWGSNSHGQLGQGTEAEQYLLPTPITITVEPKFISGGGKHTVLLTSNHEIFSCGDNDKEQLGQEQKVKLVNTFCCLNIRLKVAKLSCGWDFNLVLTEDGEVFGWGSNSFGQLGLSVENVKCVGAPCKIFDKKARSVGAGLRHSAVVTSDGLVYASGFSRKGQLGILFNKNVPSIVDKFTSVEGIKDCQEISCGECHCAAITTNGELFSWGNNKYGQLGFNPSTISFTFTPVQVKCNKNIGTSHLFSGWSHNFILTEKGQLITWGRNNFGQLGEQRQHNWYPECIKNLEKVKQVCLGSHHSVALTENERVLTWGWNEHGNCGNNTCDNILQPYKIEGITGVKLIGTGAAHSFLIGEQNEYLSTRD